MRHFELRKGLDLPITGGPINYEAENVKVTSSAIIGDDYIGLKPRLVVEEGESVSPGSPILFDKDNPGCKIVSPIHGTVSSINRGARRRLISVIVQADEQVHTKQDDIDVDELNSTPKLVDLLCTYGLWTSFKTRPYSKVPMPDERPTTIYITAIDTEPLSPDPAQIIAAESEAFWAGVSAVASLSEGLTYICLNDSMILDSAQSEGRLENNNIEAVMFSGPHPAGLPGTHMHFLRPPTIEQPVWTIGYHDVIVIGRLLSTRIFDPSRTISLCGPACMQPKLVNVVAGASLKDLFSNELENAENIRMISGSVLSGRAAEGPGAFLGRYARQATVIEEDRKQIPLGWIRPMPSKFAMQPVLGSALSKRLFHLTSNLNGGRRAMVPTGTFEQLMPQDFLPTQLLRALIVMDTDQAQALGALELDEEDLALADFACPAKYEYGVALRDCLAKIEKEG